MPKLPSKLPPMSAVRVFEAAARHQSFTRAAEELGMTQAAVSYQIKILEDRVGAPLFIRLPRQVTLTAKGRQLAPAVTEAFEALRNAFAGVEEAVQTVLSITTLSTFASNWLVPRLGRFRQLHPNIAVQISVSTEMVEFAQSEFDIGITERHGRLAGARDACSVSQPVHACLQPGAAPETSNCASPSTFSNCRSSRRAIPGGRIGSLRQECTNVDLSRRPDNSLGVQQFEGMAAIAGQGVALINPSSSRTIWRQGGSSSPSTCWPPRIGAIGWSIRKPAGAPPRSRLSGIGC